jgi:predicted nucleic acid-binding protein
MSHLYFDASALVKRYLSESGTAWVRTLTRSNANHIVVVAEVTQVEVAAAFAGRHRAPKGISRNERDNAVNLLRMHCITEYQAAPINQSIVERAVDLTQAYRLRGYDAIQLAAALEVNDPLIAAGLPSLTFIAADVDLIVAANYEGLPTDNPNLHP